MSGLIILGVIVVLIVLVIGLYNGLVAKRIACDGAWSQISVGLKRRHDLIPNLVETVKGYAAHERQTLDAVIKARQTAMGAQTPADAAAAENLLGGALRQLFALSEAYPDLKANASFVQLQSQLAETENQISSVRQDYNHAVTAYNTAREVFPSVLIAQLFRFEPRQFFELENPAVERQVPQVKF